VDLPPFRFPAADIGLARAQRDLVMAWLARGLLALILALIVAALALRFPASRALLIGAIRPWRLGDLPLDPTRLDRLLVAAIPAVALVLSRAIYTWFASPTHLAVTLGSWAVFAGVLRALLGGADPFRLWAALGGAALLRSSVLLGALAVRGPGRYWFDFWTRPHARSAYIVIAFAAFLWMFLAAVLALGTYGLAGPHAAGMVLAAAGTPLAALGAVVSEVGLERALTMWNDEMALLPWGMSRILGITGFLDIPESLPKVVAAVGGLAVLGGAILRFARRPARPR
jgi:hypothetical protein